MLRFEGDRDFALAANEVFARLSDARFLVRCIPDVESVSTQEADHAALILRPGFSFVRGTLETTLQVMDAIAPRSVRVLLHSKGIGSSAEVEATLTFAPQGSATRVHWVADIKTLGGLLKLVPAGLIRGAADKVINDTWAQVEQQIRAAPE